MKDRSERINGIISLSDLLAIEVTVVVVVGIEVVRNACEVSGVPLKGLSIMSDEIPRICKYCTRLYMYVRCIFQKHFGQREIPSQSRSSVRSARPSLSSSSSSMSGMPAHPSFSENKLKEFSVLQNFLGYFIRSTYS